MTLSEAPIVWQGPSWNVREVTTKDRDGQEVGRAYVDHPGSVVLVPLKETAGDLRVVTLEQYRLALDATILELPAGTREPGESYLACAQRELREETGYHATSLVHLGNCWPAPGLTSELMAVYLATGLVEDPLPGDADELITVHSTPFGELLAMANDGRLKDAKSVVAILRASAYLEQQDRDSP
jgi:ADP-ribose pyrophosphatase